MTLYRLHRNLRLFASITGCCLPALLLLLGAVVPVQAADDKKEGPPPPEDITLESKDGVQLKATYWEPEEPGKSTVPVILLHGWEGKRQEYDVLAGQLQKAGMAVLTLDLRGHGGSTKLRRPDKDADDTIDPKRMNKPDFELGMALDVWEAKKFLMKKHKEEKLNIELLTIVGADMGALVALNAAYYDWTRPILPRRRNCTGQDVKALVLLSPPRSFKGMTADIALRHPTVKSQVSTMIIVGDKDNNSDYREAKQLHSKLEGFHAVMPRDEKDPDTWKAKHQDLFLYAPKPATSLQGTKLLGSALPVDQAIMKFIELRLVNKASDYAWQERD